ncbi:MAG: prepilin-type N-terminal cleavage/methylation domain-containing protein [Candidatus Gracilibacteria bacterium]|nr:prepilin-type N-terminal cleavage/methylation domain-containing protein [Candidatus Gracilibacteria bacterium]
MLKQKNFSIQTILDKKAFTLVELIVVITILAILGTIAFISLTAYSAQSRDSVRISDLDRMKTVLELYQIDSGKYPLPTNPIDVTYSGATVWNQGTFGETVYANLSKLDKIPKDPLTDKEYTYSTTFKKNEYQLGGILEGDEISYVPTLTAPYQGGGLAQQAQAGIIEANAIIVGNYNGQMTKSLSGSICSILATPSIIASNITTSTDLQTIVNSGNLVYRGFKNLPSSFFGSKFKQDGGFDFTPNSLLSYTDTNNCDVLTSKTSYAERVQLLAGLQNSYSGTIVQNEGEIKNILSLDITDVNNPSNDVINYAGNFVNNVLGGNIVAVSISSTSSSGGPVSRFVSSADKTVVTDNDTGLKWQSHRDLSGDLPSNDLTIYSPGIVSGDDYCANLNLGIYNTGWRLPTQSELEYIRNPDLSMDTAYFTYQADWYYAYYLGGPLQWVEFVFSDFIFSKANAMGPALSLRCVHD